MTYEPTPGQFDGASGQFEGAPGRFEGTPGQFEDTSDPAGGTPDPKPRPKGAFAQAAAEEFSLQAVTGGWRGVAESVGPAVVFIAVNSFTQNLTWAVGAAVAVAALALLVRIVARQSPMQAVAGLLGVGICAFFAARSGEARNFFMPGFITNVAYGGVALLTLIPLPALRIGGTRHPAGPWPLLGLLIGPLLGEGVRWRADRSRARRYWWLTAAFVALFGLRLAVQIPLYLAEQVEALGTARLVMGVPLFALLVWLCWYVLHGRRPASP